MNIEPRSNLLLISNDDLFYRAARHLAADLRCVKRAFSVTRVDDAFVLLNRYEIKLVVVNQTVGDRLGVEISKEIRARHPDTRVLLAGANDSLSHRAATEAGASGYICKEHQTNVVLSAIQALMTDSSDLFVWRPAKASHILSRRQGQIMKMISDGSSNVVIAKALDLSVDTVKHHTTLIYRRLHVKNRAAAVLAADKLGLLDS